MLLESSELEPWQLGKVKSLQTHYSKLPCLDSFAAIQRLVRYMGYGDYLKEQHSDTAKLDILLALANQTPALGPFLLRLQELRTRIESPEPRPDCPFVLSTIHASKGLEYERVILIDAVDGLLPSVGEAADGLALDEDEQPLLEEERRLFYVGATRAKRQLEFLCYEKKFGEPFDGSSAFISQFLGETPSQRAGAAKQPLPEKPAGPTKAQVEAWMKDYIPNTEVTHKLFGRGIVMSRDGDAAVISFRESGIKRVSLPICLRQEKIWLTHFV